MKLAVYFYPRWKINCETKKDKQTNRKCSEEKEETMHCEIRGRETNRFFLHMSSRERLKQRKAKICLPMCRRVEESSDCHVSTHEQESLHVSLIDLYTRSLIHGERRENKRRSSVTMIRRHILVVCHCSLTFQRKTQVDFAVFAVFGDKTLRTASSKTCLRPFCVKAEHSTYLKARIFLHNR